MRANPMLLMMVAVPFLLAAAKSSGAEVEASVHDQTIKFAVPEDWRLVAQQPRPPKSVAAYQIPNSADVGTAESTNVAVSAYETADADAMAVFEQVSQKHREGRPVTTGEFEGWKIFRYSNHQKGIPYLILDATRTIGPSMVLVRFAWPQLRNNAPDYDSRMERLFHELLGSINQKNKISKPAA